MPTYTSTFSGDPVNPQNVSLNTIAFTANNQTIALSWPPSLDTADIVANTIIVTSAAAYTGCFLTMPDATETSAGAYAIFANTGLATFGVNKHDASNLLSAVAPNQYWVGLLTDNTTTAGTWISFQWGAGSSTAVASQLVGQGITTLPGLNTGLNTYVAVNVQNGDYTILATDRGKVVTAEGGNVVYTLPLTTASHIGNGFVTCIKNATATGGGGSLISLSPTPPDTLDGDTLPISLNPDDSCFVISDGAGKWLPVGLSQNSSSSLVQVLALNVVANVLESPLQAGFIIQQFTNTSGATRTVSFPQIAQQYYLSNLTGSTYPVIVTCVGGTTSTTLYPGDSYIFNNDGSNLNLSGTFNGTATSAAGTMGIAFGSGSVSAPSIAFQASAGSAPYTYPAVYGSGLYYNTAGSTYAAMAINGVSVLQISQTQIRVPNGSVTVPTYSFQNALTYGMYLGNSPISGTNNSVDITAGNGSTPTVQIYTSGVTITGNLTVTGSHTYSGQVDLADITHPLTTTTSNPGLAFTSDTSLSTGITHSITFGSDLSGVATLTNAVAFTASPLGGTVNGSGIVWGGVAYNTSGTTVQMVGLNGTAANPTYSFTTDTDTGIYNAGADIIGFATNGVLQLQIADTVIGSSLPFLLPVATAAAPAYSYHSDTSTGSYLVAAGDLGFAVGGVLRFDISTTAVTSTLAIHAPSGTGGAPSYTFTGDTTTGLYFGGSATVRMTCGGVDQLSINSSGCSITPLIFGPDGTAATPAYSFSSDTDTGIHSVGANHIGVTTFGTLRFDVSTTAVTSTLPFRGDTGTAAAPQYSFASDTNTGMHSAGADDLGFATNGVLRLDISTTAISSTLPFRIGNGSVTAPTYSFTNATGYGMYLGNSPISGTNNSVDITAGNGVTPTVQIYTSGVTITGTLTVTGSHIYSGQVEFADITHPLTATTTNPGLTFTSDTSLSTGITHSITFGSDLSGVATLTNALAFTASPLGGTVNGSGIVWGGVAYNTSGTAVQMVGINGTATNPTYSFINDTASGMYLIGANDLGFATNGVKRLEISTSALISSVSIQATSSYVFTNDISSGLYTLGVGTITLVTNSTEQIVISTTEIIVELPVHAIGASGAAGPNYSFYNDPDTGIYNVGANDLGFSTGGTLRFDISTTAVTSTLPFRGSAGSTGAPAYSFSSDSNTGLYSVGADDIGVSTGGTLRLDISTTAVTSTLPFRGAAGSASAPEYSFSGDTNTGMYSVGADDLGFSTGGTLRVDISTTAVTSTLPHLGANGTNSAPAYSFTASTGTGMYSPTTNQLALTAGGVEVLLVTSATIQSVINGTVTAPVYTFASGTAYGMYLGNSPISGTLNSIDITANNGTTPVVQIYNSGVTITGTLTVTGAHVYSGQVELADITHPLTATTTNPGLSFTSDTSLSTGIAHSVTFGSDLSGTATLTNALVFTASPLGGTVNGSGIVWGGVAYNTSGTTVQMVGKNGTNANPTYSFTNYTNCGMYVVLGVTAIAASGTDFFFTNAGLWGPDGVVTNPSYSFNSDSVTGMYLVSSHVLGFATNGVKQLSISTTAVSSLLQVLNIDGTAGAPAYSFTSDPDTGVYSKGANDLGFATGGVVRVDVSTTAVTSTLPFLGANGTAGAPEFSFSGDSDTGIYNVGANDLGIATNGVLRLDVSTTAVTSTLPFIGAAGAVGAPEYSFTGSTSTGMYSPAANQVALAANGTQIIGITSTGVTITGTLNVSGATVQTGQLSIGDITNPLTASTTKPGLAFIADTSLSTGIAHSTTFGTDLSGATTLTNAVVFTASAVGGATSTGKVWGGVAYNTTNTTVQMVGLDGTAANPTYSFWTGGTSGMYKVGTNDIGFSTNSTLRLDISTTAVTSTLPYLGSAGTAAAPSLSFSGDTNTGLYSVGADDIGIATNGVLRFDVSTTAVTSTLPHLSANGAAATPTYTFTNDTTTGIYYTTGPQLQFATGGTLALTIANGLITVGSSRAIANQNGSSGNPSYTFTSDNNSGMYLIGSGHLGFGVVSTLVFDISSTALTSTLPFLAPAGTAAAPSLSFSGDTNTGLYSVGADDLGFTVGGTLRMDIATTNITCTIPFQNAAGSAATPAYSFSGDTNTGIFSNGADNLGITTGGTVRFAVSTGTVTSTLPYIGPVGSAGAPTYTFSGDTDNGMYHPTTNQVGFATGGTAAMTIDASQQLWGGPWALSVLAGGQAQASGSCNFGDNGTNIAITGYSQASAGRGGQQLFHAYGTGSSSTGCLLFLESSNGSLTTPSKTTSGDTIGGISYRGYQDTTSAYTGDCGLLAFVADQDFTSTATGVHFIIRNTPNSSTTLATRLYITNGGLTGIGSATPTHVFQLTGSDDAAKTTTTTWATTSDIRIKANVRDVVNALDTINKLKPRVYNYTKDHIEHLTEQNEGRAPTGIDAQNDYYGFIADELEKVMPSCVRVSEGCSGKNTNLKVVNPHNINIMLVKAIQELAAKVESLEAKLAGVHLK